MRYSFRLAELLGHSPDPRRRPGTIKAIVEHTGLDRHQVAALLKNEVKYIPLAALSRLCDYLIENGHASPHQLPGALFAVQPENFWEFLARRKRVDFCLGVRRPEDSASIDGAWVVASDSVLLGELLNGLSTLGGTAKFDTQPSLDVEHKRLAAPPLHPEQMQQTLVWSPGQDTFEECKAQATETYETFADTMGDRGLVCLGSTKSNAVVELILSHAFGAEPFQSQDGVDNPQQRACPFFLRYRNNDPHPPSCGAGLKLCGSSGDLAPGIYYETDDGSWSVCEWDAQSKDAAFVFYIHRESQGRFEMALGGFSGRASRSLAKFLATRAQDLWPPVYEGHGIQIGAYIVQFTFSPADAKGTELLRGDLTATSKVIPISEKAVQRRVEAIL